MSSLKDKLCKEYKYRIEMHAHTLPVSPCGEVSPEELAKIYAGKGYDAVVLTNHFIMFLMDNKPKEQALDEYIESFTRLKTACTEHGLTALLGAEIRFTENNNDYLIYGVDRDILSVCYDYLPKGIEVFRSEVKLDKSVFIQAHPFRNGMERVNPDLLDGMETFNMHPGHNAAIGLASRYAKDNGIKIKTVGSDFHHISLGHEGVSALRTKTLPKDSFELAKILKSGDYLFEIGEDSIVLP